MATDDEKTRNRVSGDYQVLAELLGNGGRVKLPPVPFLPGSWTAGGTKLTFRPVRDDTTSVFLRTKTNSENIPATPTAAGVITVTPDGTLFPSVSVVEYVAFYTIDDKLTAFGSVRP
jgi:hypothetical protein